jgi:thiol-disulfide isomerase/thioredoxin
MRLRPILLSATLALALVALARRSTLQAWAWGSHDGVRTLEGQSAPELPRDSRALDGTPLSLRALRGRVVVVHFWTFGCSNCRHMLPRYGAWLERFAPRGLSVVGVHTPELDYERDPAALARFVRDEKIRWPVVVDDDESIWSRYRVAAWPTIVVVDRAGVVRATFVGDDQSAAIEETLTKLLARSP